jgi:hypothetical protein
MGPSAPDPAYWRSTTSQASPADLQFLLDASKYLLGYRVHLAYKQFLDVIIGNFERWYEHGLIRNLRESAPVHPVAFDFGAIDLEYLTRALGVYLYIYSCHKGANHRLMHSFPGKQVLYLRGYEFAVSLAVGEGMAAEASSVETLRFNTTVEKLIGPDLCVFKVLSPEEAYWGTEALDRCFREPDIDAIAQKAMRPFRSVFMNALHWQRGVLALLDPMDHFLVYVSCITPSAMWELEQLDIDSRRGRVTVVFDAQAISSRSGILGYQKKMLDEGSKFIWPKNAPPPTVTPEDLHASLAEKFHVVTLDDFIANLGKHCERIASTSSSLPPGQRETSLDFQFHPAIADAPLADLRDYSAWLKARIETAIARQGIVCPLLFLNDIQLRIYSTLLLGEHDETGRALAAYTGMLRAVLAKQLRTPELKIWQSPFPREENVSLLETHIQVARDWGVSLMSCGPSDRFESIYEQAKTEFLEREASAAAAVDKLLHRWPIDQG